MAHYSVQLEVAGPLAMFSRPDTGGTPTSYPVPTWSAAKGIFESIAFFADGSAWVCPTNGGRSAVRSETAPTVEKDSITVVVFASSATRRTTEGPLRKASLLGKGTGPGGSSMQQFATALSGVCYRLHADIVGPRRRGPINPRHHLQEVFNRRLERGQCHRTPCLGWSEFTCSYWGPFRHGETDVDVDLSLDIPSMLLAVWEKRATRPTPDRGTHRNSLKGSATDPAASRCP